MDFKDFVNTYIVKLENCIWYLCFCGFWIITI